MKAYKYRIYPTKAQAIIIDENIEACRQLYNKLLSLKITAYEKDKRVISRNDLNKKIKGTVELHSQVCQNVSNRIDNAFKNFFAKIKRNEQVKGFPRFKKYGTYSSITLPQVVNFENIGRKTYFPKIGWLNTKYHRSITGIPKTVTIKKAKSGKYFLTVCCENTISEPMKTASKAVGIDLGLNHFVATSDGEFFDHPKPLKKLAEKRKWLNKQFSKTRKRSHNRNKARMKLAILDEKINNIRTEFGWKLCNILTKKYGLIFVENLNVSGMLQNHYLAKSINDVSWNDFLQKLFYKAESAGGKVIKVNPKNTSKICSSCSSIQAMPLNKREYACSCGLKLDRDVNSAKNILTIGKIGMEPPELSLKEMKSLYSAKTVMQTASMKQETNQFIDW